MERVAIVARLKEGHEAAPVSIDAIVGSGSWA